jgi:hypothetical protein
MSRFREKIEKVHFRLKFGHFRPKFGRTGIFPKNRAVTSAFTLTPIFMHNTKKNNDPILRKRRYWRTFIPRLFSVVFGGAGAGDCVLLLTH